MTYSFGVVRWTKTELEGMERNIRVQLHKNRMSHPKTAIERSTLPRSKGGRGIISLIWLHQKQIHTIKAYFQKRKANSRLHTAVIKADERLTGIQLNEEPEQTEKPTKLQDEGERLAQWK